MSDTWHDYRERGGRDRPAGRPTSDGGSGSIIVIVAGGGRRGAGDDGAPPGRRGGARGRQRGLGAEALLPRPAPRGAPGAADGLPGGGGPRASGRRAEGPARPLLPLRPARQPAGGGRTAPSRRTSDRGR